MARHRSPTVTGHCPLSPRRRFARYDEPELLDLTVAGATDRGYQTNRVLQRRQVQR